MQAIKPSSGFQFPSKVLGRDDIASEKIEDALHDEAVTILTDMCRDYPDKVPAILEASDEIVEDSKLRKESKPETWTKNLTQSLKEKLMAAGFCDEFALKIIVNLKYLSRVAPDKLDCLETYKTIDAPTNRMSVDNEKSLAGFQESRAC